jgi:hypothetical protein
MRAETPRRGEEANNPKKPRPSWLPGSPDLPRSMNQTRTSTFLGNFFSPKPGVGLSKAKLSVKMDGKYRFFGKEGR